MLGCHGTAAGHGSVRGDRDWGRLSTMGLWVPSAGWRSPGPQGSHRGCAHTVSTPSLRDSPPVITAPAPYQYPVSAFSPRLAEGIKGRKGGLQGEAWQCKDLQGQRMLREQASQQLKNGGHEWSANGLLQPQSEESWDANLALHERTALRLASRETHDTSPKLGRTGV